MTVWVEANRVYCDAADVETANKQSDRGQRKAAGRENYYRPDHRRFSLSTGAACCASNAGVSEDYWFIS